MSSLRCSSRRLWPTAALLTLAATMAMASGCASPDEPTARHPIVPQPVQDLQAQQQGQEIILSFTLPNQSTRKEPLATPPAIEIYRAALEPGGRPPEKVQPRLVYTIPGEMAGSYLAGGRIIYHDAVEPGELVAAGAGIGRVYVVRTRAARNRASAESNRVALQIQAAAQPVGNVNARVAGQSVTLTWPREATGEYHVYRAEIAPESVAAASTDASKAVLRMPLVQVARMDASSNSGTASLLQYRDENVELGHAYLYLVRRVLPQGSVESADSNPVAIAATETVLPSAPQGLEAVVVPASAQAAAYVSLSWAISTEQDVAGYAIYRSEQEGTLGVRLNGDRLVSPTYRDATVTAGRQYFYSVTAFDAAGQESPPSAAVEAEIPGP